MSSMSTTPHSQEGSDRELKGPEALKDPEKGSQPALSPTGPASSPPPLHLPPAAYLTLVGGWLALFCGFGFLNAFGVFESYYKEQIIPSTSESTISWIGSFQSFWMLAANVIAGPAQDKFGPKPLLLFAAICFCFSCMMVSLCHQWWHLFLAQGVLQGMALSIGFAPPMVCVLQWFKHKGPLGVAVIVSGSSVGGVVWPIVVRALLSNVGFGWTWRALGFIGGGLLLISTVLTSQPDMFDGQDGEDDVAHNKRGRVTKFLLVSFGLYRSSKKRPPKRAFFYFDVLKLLSFQMTLVAWMFIYLGLFYTFFYLPSWGRLYGLSEDMSFYSISILNAASFFGRLFLPFPALKVGAFNVAIPCALASAVVVYASLAVDTSAGVLIIGAFYGFTSGGLISLLSPCIAPLCPDKTRIGSAVGQFAAMCSVASLLSGPIGGWIIGAGKTPQQGFHGAQGFSAGCLTLGAIFLFVAKLVINRNPLDKV